MTDLALFAIGTIVFFLGGTGLVLYGLDVFQAWSVADTSDDETAGEALNDPTRPSH
jgi:hypothetical protein